MSSGDQPGKPARQIGVLGGTFDPIHNAHCEIARAACEQASLDRVLFVVSARPPHKSGETFACAEDRYAMVEAAVRGEARLEASRIEIERPGASYTVDTLREIGSQYPGARLFLIIGYDSLLDLPQWRDPRGIMDLARLLVVPRPGPRRDPPSECAGHFDLLAYPETALSSTEVRERIRAGQPFGRLVPPGVEALIRQKGLYDAARPSSPR